MFRSPQASRWLGLFLLIFHGVAGAAGVVLAPESSSFAGGGELRLTLWLNNPGPDEATVTLPRPLRARLTAGDRAAEVTLEADPPLADAIRLAPRSFQRVLLRGRVPADLEGPVTAELPGAGVEPVMFDVTAAPPELVAAEARARIQDEVREEFRKHSPEWFSFFDRFSPYDPMYFVAGLRADFTADTGHADWSPRINARYTLFGTDTHRPKSFAGGDGKDSETGAGAGAETDEGSARLRTTLKGGVGLFHQPPTFQETDEVFGTPNLKSNRAVHYSLGVEQDLSSQVELSVEGW